MTGLKASRFANPNHNRESSIEDDPRLQDVFEADGSIQVRIGFQDKIAVFIAGPADQYSWLTRAAAEFIRFYASGQTSGTVYSKLCYLQTFLKFVRSGQRMWSSPEAFPVSIGRDFERWLNVQPNPRKPGESLMLRTKYTAYDAFRDLVDWGRTTGRYAFSQDIALNYNPWPRTNKKSDDVRIVSDPDYAAIRAACISEVKATIAKLKRGRQILRDPSIVVPPLDAHWSAYSDVEVMAKTIRTIFDGPIGVVEDIKSVRPRLSLAMDRNWPGLSAIGEYFYFTPRTITPFVILLVMDTYFNPETMLYLNKSQIERSHYFFGDARWRVAGEKRRSGRLQYRSFSSRIKDWDSPTFLFLLLEKFTEPMRRFAPAKFNDRVFLFGGLRGKEFVSFNSIAKGRSDSFSRLLKAFRDKHDLCEFTLKDLRSTGGDIIHRLTGDVEAQQRAQNHQNKSTTIAAYHATSARRRDEQALAKSMARRGRFIETGGRSRTDETDSSHGLEHAATPGFLCLDPYNSDQPGQKAGKLCSAFGYCPSCPSAVVDEADPKALAMLLQFREKLEHTRNSVAAARWVNHWRPQLAALDRTWLPQFGPAAVAAASEIPLTQMLELD